ncbi:MOSC domain-containing protein [Oceanospirillum sediminis]|uniref:MOSC N-terminal beta barrel domain-containing protein n=1 Tax=Oceanospirillum sediminis TaxID=2760088 RepID=A0A839IKR7_9GAMM|nr:MOSC N-terminal beta barrel domain-containing protein [Oceanospirillum sediminis]
MAEVSGLFVYPVKSLRGISLESSVLGIRGLQWDRLWMVTDQSGNFVTQRNLPRMASVSVAITDETLCLSHADHGDCPVPLVMAENTTAVKAVVWGDECDAFDEGNIVSEWLTGVLGEWKGQSLRLVRFCENYQRQVDPEYTKADVAHTAFSDGFPLLVTSEASLEALNQSLSAKGASQVTMERFRPNIVLKNTVAFEEDRVDQLMSDKGFVLALRKPCQRCKVTSIDQLSGEIAEPKEPLATLIAMKTQPDLKGAFFGQNGILLSGEGSVIQVGDLLEISLK